MITIQPKRREEEVVAKDAEDKSASDEANNAEEDAPVDAREKIKVPIVCHPADTTLNLLVSPFEGLLTTLSEGGLQHLFAGARYNVGIKSGRYMFEVTIVGCMAGENSGPKSHVPKSYLRVGFSIYSAMPVLGDHLDCAYYDSEGCLGMFASDSKKKKGGHEIFHSGDTVAVVLNVNGGETKMSLYRNGVRFASPQELPAGLVGKPLHPTVSFRGMVLKVNFGPKPVVPLPFKCRMLQDAANADVAVSTCKSSSGNCNTVLFPVCLPDEGSFDWLDTFLEDNPHFTEISDRKILDWATKSGFPRSDRTNKSNDKPGVIDDGAIKRVLLMTAAMQKRDVVIMEVKGNFIKEERQPLIDNFRFPNFKKVAHILIGEPPADFKEKMRQVNLATKQEKLNEEHKLKAQARLRQRMLAERQKEAQEALNKRKSGDKDWLEKLYAKRRKLEEDKKQGAGDDKAEDEVKEEDTKDEGVKEEEVKEEDTKDDIKHEEDVKQEEDAAEEDPPPVAELSPEEARQWVRIGNRDRVPDIDSSTLMEAFSNFSLPSKQEEGFDEVNFVWQGSDESHQYLETWKQRFKLSVRIENIQVSDWFKTKVAMWTRDQLIWKKRTEDYLRVVADQRRKEALDPKPRKKPKPEEDSRKRKSKWDEKPEEQVALLGDITVCRGKTIAEVVDELVKRDGLNVFKVANILDIGDGEPLFANFGQEDWQLATLRFEVCLLVYSFQRDVKEYAGKGLPCEHLLYYYSKYFKKVLTPKNFGAENAEELLGLIKDIVALDPATKIIHCPSFAEEFDSNEIFVKLTEAARVERHMRVKSGEDAANLKFVQLSVSPVAKLQNAVIEGVGIPLTKRLKDLVLAGVQNQQSLNQVKTTVQNAALAKAVVAAKDNSHLAAWAKAAAAAKAKAALLGGVGGCGFAAPGIPKAPTPLQQALAVTPLQQAAAAAKAQQMAAAARAAVAQHQPKPAAPMLGAGPRGPLPAGPLPIGMQAFLRAFATSMTGK